jgi:hypothetical protein
MKKLIIFLFVMTFLITSNNFGQFTVSNYFNPRVGEKQKMFAADTSNIFAGSGGPNQTWNFSNVVRISDTIVYNYVSPSGTPYYINFPTANIAVTYGGAYAYSYFSANDTSFENLGGQTENTKTINTDPKKYLKYPFSYNQSYVDTYRNLYYSGNPPLLGHKSTGTVSVVYDGYGSLILPSGTVSNVCRFKYVFTQIDSVFYPDTTINHTIDTLWRWYKNNYRYPIFEIEKTLYEDNIQYTGDEKLTFRGYKQVYFIPNINSVDVKLLSSGIPLNYKLEQNYPNPFNPITKIRYQIPENTKIIIKVYDVFGREIETLLNGKQNAGFYEMEWDASKYASGFYFCRLISNSFNTTMKMILVK